MASAIKSHIGMNLGKSAAIFDGQNLYISNLPYQISDSFIAETFWQGAGIEVASVEVVKNGLPGGPKKACGLALVRVKNASDGLIALTKMDGYDVLGRPMIVRPDKFVADDPQYKAAGVSTSALQAVQAAQAGRAAAL